MIQSRLQILPVRSVEDCLALLLAFDRGAQRESQPVLVLEVVHLLDYGPVWVHFDSNVVIVDFVRDMVPLGGKVDGVTKLLVAA